MSAHTQSVIENICLRIAQLDAISRQEVFERIEKMKSDHMESESVSTSPETKKTVRISDLWGVGAEIWRDEDVNEYIRKERESWNREWD